MFYLRNDERLNSNAVRHHSAGTSHLTEDTLTHLTANSMADHKHHDRGVISGDRGGHLVRSIAAEMFYLRNDERLNSNAVRHHSAGTSHLTERYFDTFDCKFYGGDHKHHDRCSMTYL
ncbi:hypothetical protein CEXT_254591 [Caerostris extrusa]|uniref:Uncharacterized protein n=1 Tax=Caerostris extrusa TaxID=172846 RepID=A0AAV4NR86_CAEEX|nr:hypothetical protein CEXT_254591 [Caerostris extrusa]